MKWNYRYFRDGIWPMYLGIEPLIEQFLNILQKPYEEVRKYKSRDYTLITNHGNIKLTTSPIGSYALIKNNICKCAGGNSNMNAHLYCKRNLDYRYMIV